MLFDESQEELVPIREIAWESWYSEGGGAPMSSAGGHTLSELAPGLGYSKATGDNLEMEDSADPFCVLPQDPESLGEFLAEWVLEHDAEVAAALSLEPFDPDGRLSATEREEWESRLDGDVPVSFGLNAEKKTRKSLRQALMNRSQRYIDTAEGLRNPGEPEGEALAEALDAAYDGHTAYLIRGDW